MSRLPTCETLNRLTAIEKCKLFFVWVALDDHNGRYVSIGKADAIHLVKLDDSIQQDALWGQKASTKLSFVYNATLERCVMQSVRTNLASKGQSALNV